MALGVLGCVLVGCGAAAVVAPQAYAHVGRGASLLAAGALDESEANYRLALEYDNHIAEAHVGLGLIAMRRGHLGEAERHLHSAIEINEDMVEAHNALGALSADRGDLAGAVDAFEAVLRIDPGQSDARYNLAVLHTMAERYAPARAHLLRLAQYSESADVHALLGFCEFQLGRRIAALQQVDRALRVDGENARAFLVAGLVWLDNNALGHARAAFGAAILAAEERREDETTSRFERTVQAKLLIMARVGVMEAALLQGDMPEARLQLRTIERAGAPGRLLMQLERRFRRAEQLSVGQQAARR